MNFLDQLRLWLSRNLAPVVFLAAYFMTVVLGNIIYWLPFGKGLLERDAYTATILGFETLFTPGYWLLLFMPFVVAPLVVVLTKKTFGRIIEKGAIRLFEFSVAGYAFVTIASYSFVVYSLFRADAFSLFLAGSDAVSSVVARFQIRDQLGFAPLAVLMSILHYLSVYALVRWMLSRGRFWFFATITNAIMMSLFLTMLNMKWPILIFYAGLVLAIFVYAKRYPYIKAILGGVLLILMYFLISAFVFRLVPAVQSDEIRSEIGMSNDPHGPRHHQSPGVVGSVASIGGAAAQNAPMLLFNVVNRMAIIYPYYYQVFTLEGQVCGGVAAQAKIGQPCRPSTYIYSRMFEDQFKGRGTAPAAVQISAYALGGWPLSVFALICASVILGIFASLPLRASATVGSLVISGAIVGYHFSQLPGEGPIFYDHGIVWTLLVLVLFGTWRALYNRFGPGRVDLSA